MRTWLLLKIKSVVLFPILDGNSANSSSFLVYIMPLVSPCMNPCVSTSVLSPIKRKEYLFPMELFCKDMFVRHFYIFVINPIEFLGMKSLFAKYYKVWLQGLLKYLFTGYFICYDIKSVENFTLPTISILFVIHSSAKLIYDKFWALKKWLL